MNVQRSSPAAKFCLRTARMTRTLCRRLAVRQRLIVSEPCSKSESLFMSLWYLIPYFMPMTPRLVDTLIPGTSAFLFPDSCLAWSTQEGTWLAFGLLCFSWKMGGVHPDFTSQGIVSVSSVSSVRPFCQQVRSTKRSRLVEVDYEHFYWFKTFDDKNV